MSTSILMETSTTGGENMWELVIMPLITLGVGFFCGVLVGDTASTNVQIDNLRKEINKLRRQIEVRRRQNEGSYID